MNDNGLIRVEGEFVLLDSAENALPSDEPGRAALCRCGGSGNKPFCDGTHQREGFQSEIQLPRTSAG